MKNWLQSFPVAKNNNREKFRELFDSQSTQMWKEKNFFHLYNPHGQTSLLRQLLPKVPGGFRGWREGCLQNLQLFRLYSGPRTAPLRAGTAVATATAGTAIRTFILRLAVSRFRVAIQGTFNRSKPSCRITIIRPPPPPPGAYFIRLAESTTDKYQRK